MKNQNKILIVVTTLIMLFSMCFISTTTNAAQLDKLSTTRKGVTTTTEPVFSSSEDTGTTESTTETTVVTTADKGNSTLHVRTSTNRADRNSTATEATEVTADDTTEVTTIRGTTKEFAATGAPVEYEDTTYRAGNTFAATEATFTTEPMVITDEDSYTTIGPTYNVTDYNNGIEVYTYFGETTDFNGDVVESTENNEDESFIKTNYKKLLSGLFIIIAVGLIAALVMFLKNRRDFRSSLYFKF